MNNIEKIKITNEATIKQALEIISDGAIQIAIVVDKKVTLKPGAELFTLAIGPKKEGWKPFGSDAQPDESEVSSYGNSKLYLEW